MKIANIKLAAEIAARLERTKEVRGNAYAAAGQYAGTLAAVEAARLKTAIPTDTIATQIGEMLVRLLDAECARLAQELTALGIEDADRSAA